MTKITKFWGLLEYTPQWILTLKGWLLILLFLAVIGWIIITHIQPFLAMNKPLQADALLVEGWVGDPVLQGAAAEFKRGNYQLIITTGSTLYRGYFLSEYKNNAQLAAATLEVLGCPQEQIFPVPNDPVKIDRTAASAIAVKNWLSENNLNIKTINIYSHDVHTRRSWYIYQRVLNPEIKLGAIAHLATYNNQQWWTSSMGFRSVISEAIAYIYARFFWHYHH